MWVHVISQVFLWAGLDAQACAVSEAALCGCADCSRECLYKIIISSSFSYKRTQCCPFRIEEKKKKPHKYCKVAKYKEKELLPVLATLERKRQSRGGLGLVRCGEDARRRGVCFLKFRVPGISNAVKSDKSPDLPDTNSSCEKPGFRVFGNLGEGWSSYWNVAYRWLTDLKWNVSKWQCLPFCPPLEHASEQLPCRLWGWRASGSHLCQLLF